MRKGWICFWDWAKGSRKEEAWRGGPETRNEKAMEGGARSIF